MSTRKAKTTSRARAPRVERIDPSQLAYHRKVMARYQWALQVQQEAAAALAAAAAWAAHLHEEYGLDAAAGDGVDETGRIIRASQNGVGAAEATPQ